VASSGIKQYNFSRPRLAGNFYPDFSWKSIIQTFGL
jgi:hypothetical protein